MFSGAAKFVVVVIVALVIIDFTLTASELQSVCGEINVTTSYNVSRTVRVTYIESKDGLTRLRSRNEIHYFLENGTELQEVCCPGFIKHGNSCLIVNCSIPDVFPSHLSAVNNECSSGATIEYNTSCSFKCDTGYNTTGPASSSCTESAELSMDLPNCTVVTCSIPDEFPQHVIPIGDNCTYGSIIEYDTSCAYECDTGYQTTDLTKVSCSESGLLSGDLPTCIVVDCSIPDVFPSHLSAVNNECSSGATIEYNTSCSYKCDTGYKTTGPASLLCTEIGELSMDLPNCTVVTCSIPDEFPQHVIAIGANCTYGSIIEYDTSCAYECDTGYQTTDLTKVSCSESGLLSGDLPTCIVVDCSIPDVFPPHLSAVNECSSGATIEYNTSCSYKCDTGYNTTGPASLSCTESGELSMDLPNCTVVTCSIPDEFPQHVIAIGDNCTSGSSIEYDTSCAYECDTGYQTTDLTKVSCSESGLLSGDLPTCIVVNCSIPDIFPSHLSAVNIECSSGSTIEYNTSCSYECDTGYKTTGPASSSCTESGELSMDLPNCTVVTCSIPDEFPPHVIAIGDNCTSGSSIEYDTSCAYECDTGYQTTDLTKVSCSESGLLSGDLPSCIVVTCSIPDEFPPHVIAIGANCTCGSIIEYDTSCAYECDTGYQTTDLAKVSCSESGLLSGNLPNCTAITCSIPEVFPLHLNAVNNNCSSGSSIEYNTTCIYECDTGYKTIDLTHLTCTENAALSTDLPKCSDVTCSIPDILPSHLNATNNDCSSGSTIAFNTSCTYECDTGYKATGPTSLSCTESNALSEDFPDCTVVTCSLPDMFPSHLSAENNECSSGSTIEYNTSCTYGCDTGYETTGPTSLSCTEGGELSVDFPNCTVVTCSIPDVFPSHLSAVNNECSSRSTIEYNTSCTYECDIGYKTTGPASLSCTESGELSLDLPNCTVVTCAIPDVLPSHLNTINNECSPGSAIEYNSSCSYECDTGYQLSGPTSLSCTQSGELSVDLPSCTVVTCSIPDVFPSHVSATESQCSSGSTIEYNASCTYECDTGYKTTDPTTSSCTESGELSRALPNCTVVTCSIPDVFPSHLRAENNECSSGFIIEYNTSCTYECDTGYKTTDDASLSCTESGKLSGDLPICTVVTCSIPDALPSHLTTVNNKCTSGATIEYNTSCTYTCDTGYQISGPTTLTCTEDDAPSINLPDCTVVTCSIPDVFPSHVSATESQCSSGSTIEYNASCTYECDTGYKTMGPTSLSCTESGELSGSLPNCTDVTCTIPDDFPSHLSSVDDQCLPRSVIGYNIICTYVCDTGYNLVGPNLLTCTGSGALSAALPSCASVTCDVPSTTDSVTTTCDAGSRVTYSTSCEFSCTSGVIESGNSERFCRADGTFSGSDLTCAEVMCNIPVYSTPLSSSQCHSGARVTVGTLCQFTCESGNVTQPASISCTNTGQLQIDIPQCLETCGSEVCSEGQYCGANETCLCVRGSLTARGVCSDSCGGICSIDEICTTNSETGVSSCDCAPGKVREMDNDQCLDAVNLEGTITVLEINGSEAIYSEELGDTGSSEFQQIASRISQQIMSTIGSVNNSVDDVTVTSITSGSLIITYELVFATAPEANPEELADELSIILRHHLDSNNGILDSTTSTIFQVDRDVPPLQVLIMDECSDPQSNDCSSNASCINHNMAGGFTCECLPEYRDIYPEVLPGRFCFPNPPETSDPDVPVTGKAMYLAIGIVCGIFILFVVLILLLLGIRAYVNSRWRKYYEEESVYNHTKSESYSRKYPHLESHHIGRNGGFIDKMKNTKLKDHPLYVNYTRTNCENGRMTRTSRRKGLTINSEGPKFSSDGPIRSSAETNTDLEYAKAILTNSYYGHGGQHLHYPYHNGIVIKDHLHQTNRLENGNAVRYSAQKPRGDMRQWDHLYSPHRATYVTRF